MKIESIKINNYKALKAVSLIDIPNMAVFLGMNGAGKTTLFDVFGFLNDALNSNVRSALSKRGGFKEVVSRGQKGDIEIELKFRPSKDEPLITYELKIGLNEKKQPCIKKEIMRYRRGQTGAPWKILDFENGEGMAANGDLNKYDDVRLSERKLQKLDSPDILAIKGLGQFKEFIPVTMLRRLIEDWYVCDFHIEDARGTKDAGYSERLSKTGDNLPLVTKYLYDNHRDVFEEILRKMESRIPGIKEVQAKETDDGRIVLRFQDSHFQDPFISRFVSDGTIKMFSYLVLLNDPEKHALLCVEEPENQLYPHLLGILAEEFRLYSVSGGQVFISTHSTEFIDSVNIDELYCLVKRDGYTTIVRALDDPQIKALIDAGDSLGSLWRQGLLVNEDM